MRSQRQRTRSTRPDAPSADLRARPARLPAHAAAWCPAAQGGHHVSGIIYLIGLAVVVYFVLRLLGLV
jgi:hypothetical protein